MDEQLVALATGALDGAEAARLEATIDGDPIRRKQLAQLRQALAVMAHGPWPEPGDPARTAVLAAFRDRAARAAMVTSESGAAASPGAVERLVTATRSWIDAAECVVADLVFDRRQQVAMAGFRGSGGGVSYATEHGRLDLDIQSSDSESGRGRPRARVRGQFRETETPASGHAADRRLLIIDERGVPVVDTATDDRGSFQAELPIGRCDLFLVQSDGRRFAVRDLVVD